MMQLWRKKLYYGVCLAVVGDVAIVVVEVHIRRNQGGRVYRTVDKIIFSWRRLLFQVCIHDNEIEENGKWSNGQGDDAHSLNRNFLTLHSKHFQKGTYGNMKDLTSQQLGRRHHF